MLNKTTESSLPHVIVDAKIFKSIRNAVLKFLQLLPSRRSSAQQDLKQRFFRNESFMRSEGNIWNNKVNEPLMYAFFTDYEIQMEAKKFLGSMSSYLLSLNKAPMATISSFKDGSCKDDEERKNIILSYSSEAPIDQLFGPVINIDCKMQFSEEKNKKSMPNPLAEMNHSVEYLYHEDAWRIATSPNNDIKNVPNLDVQHNEVVSEFMVTPEDGYFPKAFTFILISAGTKKIAKDINCDGHVDDKEINKIKISERGLGFKMSRGTQSKKESLQHCSYPNVYVETIASKATVVQHEASNFNNWNNEMEIEILPPVEHKFNVVVPKSTKFQQHPKTLFVTENMVLDSQPYASPKECIECYTEKLTYERINLEIPKEIAIYERHPTRLFDDENASTLLGEYLMQENGHDVSVYRKYPIDRKFAAETEKDSTERRTEVKRLIRWLHKKTRRIARILICG